MLLKGVSLDKSQTDLNFDEFALKLIFGAFIFSRGKPKTLVSMTGNSHRSPLFCRFDRIGLLVDSDESVRA